MLNSMIKVSNLTKAYLKGNNTIKDVSFDVHEGDLHAFVGVNGSGKTTIIKSILGAFEKFEGQILIGGMKHTSIESKKLIGFVPEHSAFPMGISTIKFLAYIGYIEGMSMEDAKKSALKMLKKYGIDKYANKSPNSLSTGEKKKVMLIQALISSPKILIMDEPTANFDPIASSEFYSNIKDLTKKGITIFVSTHKLDAIEEYVNSITIINNGKILYTGPKNKFAPKGQLNKKFIKVVKRDKNA